MVAHGLAPPTAMNFQPSPRAVEWLARLEAFLERFVLPYNAAWQAAVGRGEPPPFAAELRALAREEGLWNLCLPRLPAGAPGTPLPHLDYAPLAEAIGRLPWSAEVFNCNAPDSGNMELLLQSGSPAQHVRWLQPLAAGEMRSAFAMSEPDVASSDPTNLQTEVRREGGELVVSGRKWFVTGAAHPDCRLLIVVCRNAGAPEQERHRAHSLVLVPADAAGVEVVRNIPILQHTALEGHCELVFRQVRVPAENLLGGWGEGFALAQARLGPGRVHHCMRTIGQCELALALACDRALERRAFGKAVAQQANVQEWLAESRLEIDQARLLVLRTAWAWTSPSRRPACASRSPRSRWSPRGCSSAWWIARSRCSAPWACRPTRRWPGCSPGGARCASWTAPTRCTCAPWRAVNCAGPARSAASGRRISRRRSSWRRRCGCGRAGGAAAWPRMTCPRWREWRVHAGGGVFVGWW